VDVEFLVQLLQLKHGGRIAALRSTNTWDALEAARKAGLLTETDFEALRQGYDFLRLVESRLRIVQNRSLDELPDNPDDLEKLARRLGYQTTVQASAAQVFLNELNAHTARIRELFKRLTRDGEAKGQK
jgi:[glutamine synthetase] adenylyltransferase / [glutamine synthetase]-adenylyl-L-tyrosine phosphorylase